MQQISSLGQDRLASLAQQYSLSLDAVTSLMHAVQRGNGTMAQFSHPELGGTGQWMQGGMIMIGDMFNNQLKASIDGLCYQLSNFIYEPAFWMPIEEPSTRGNSPSGNSDWWPSSLGTPTAVGSQNQYGYALFSSTNRLAIKVNNTVTVYDTTGYTINGFSQQQGSGTPMLKMSTYQGEITLTDLKEVNLRG